jgi:uncharacterized protein (DUF2147 family)
MGIVTMYKSANFIIFSNMKLTICIILCAIVQGIFANEAPKIEGIWTCSDKDCKVEIVKNGNTYEAKLLWARKEIDEKGNPKLDIKNPDPAKRNLPIIGGKTLWNATYNSGTGYFEEATAYRNGRYFCGKFKLNTNGTLSIVGYNCTFKFLKFSETWTRVK